MKSALRRHESNWSPSGAIGPCCRTRRNFLKYLPGLIPPRWLHEGLAAAVERLPHDLKVVLLLHHYEALSYREIAAVIGCGERGFEARLARARQRLERLLGYRT